MEEDIKKIYHKKLQDKRWKEKAESILKRDGYKCTECGNTENLQVHHMYYESRFFGGMPVDPWDYPDSALITLCDKCHLKFHNNFDIEIRYRRNHNIPLAPGAWIDKDGKVVAPPLVKKEDLFQFISECDNITYDSLKQFFAEHKINYDK